MEISIEMVKELRNQCSAGVMECRNALLEVEGDLGKALQVLKEKGLLKAEKKVDRVTGQGLVEAYIHTGGRIGALVEVNCETDFVARTDEFKGLAHDLAMQVAALSPQYISEEELPEGADIEPQVACLLQQPFIRDSAQTVRDIIVEVIAKVGENIRVSRFSRFELGVRDEEDD
ncbi:MAG: translation elongation factor Ts [Dehalococcoidia bacterium]|nr:translation elongation factor Ts [Dehalococcoidia bacterium]